MATIGFVGAGIMGAPMIQNLRAAGHSIKCYARTAETRERALKAGAKPVDSIKEACSGAQMAITMLPDGPDVAEVALCANGLLDSLPDGAVWVDCSTISPDDARRMHREASERGISALDAPVSGGEAGAVEGTLSIMVGGDQKVFDEAITVLRSVGQTVVRVGGAGAGQVVKAANQLIVAGNIQMLAEATVFLEAHGADVEIAYDVLAGGLAGSTVLQRKRKNMLHREFEPGFRVQLHDKDLGIVAQASRNAGLALPATSLVTTLVAALRNQGGGNLDHSALLQLLSGMNPSPVHTRTETE